MRIKYFKISNKYTPENYSIWLKRGSMEKLIYNTDGIENNEYTDWHDPRDIDIISIPDIINSVGIGDGCEDITIEELQKDEVFLDMV